MRKIVIITAAIAAGGVLLVGCGSGTSASPATVTTTQATTATVTVTRSSTPTSALTTTVSGTSSSVSSGTSTSSASSGTTPLSATTATPPSMRITELDQVDSYGSTDTGQAAVSGTTYSFSQLLSATNYSNSWVEYNLSRNWTNLHTVVGMSDQAPAISDLQYIISVDGVAVSQGDIRLGTSIPLDIPVKNGLRLRLEMVDVNADTANNGGTLVYGDPTVSK